MTPPLTALFAVPGFQFGKPFEGEIEKHMESGGMYRWKYDGERFSFWSECSQEWVNNDPTYGLLAEPRFRPAQPKPLLEWKKVSAFKSDEFIIVDSQDGSTSPVMLRKWSTGQLAWFASESAAMAWAESHAKGVGK